MVLNQSVGELLDIVVFRALLGNLRDGDLVLIVHCQALRQVAVERSTGRPRSRLCAWLHRRCARLSGLLLLSKLLLSELLLSGLLLLAQSLRRILSHHNAD